MDTMIKEINGSLREIIDNLSEVKDASASVLAEVELKIGEKMDEAKLYKNEVEANKKSIKGLEDEITDLENDLADLNERFGKKDLTAIIETGNREINNKIGEKQSLISKHRQKIGELTEKGRGIKELLNSLKKDKSTKEARLIMLTKIYNYYNEQIGKIIEHAEENPNQLDAYAPNIKAYTKEDMDSSLEGIFDEIEAINKEDDFFDEDESDNSGESISLNIKNIKESVVEEEIAFDDIYEKLKTKKTAKVEVDEETTDFEDPFADEDSEVEEELDNQNESMKLSEEVDTTNFFDNIPAIGLDSNDEPLVEDNGVLETFLLDNDLALERFNASALNNMKTDFNPEKASQVIKILNDNKINLDNLFHSPQILNHPNPEELSKIITKLLLADQTTANIGLVIGKLKDIKIKELNDVVKSLGAEIKNANIIELVLNSNKESINIDIAYINELGFTDEEVNDMATSLPTPVLEAMSIFPELIRVNFNSLNKFGIANMKDVFSGYAHMFLQNPDRFDSVLDKYDPSDLVRCVEKNAAVIEKL